VKAWFRKVCGCVFDQAVDQEIGVQAPQSHEMALVGGGRPDLSNIDNLGEPLRSERLRAALRPFLAHRYDLGSLLPNEEIGEGLCLGVSLLQITQSLSGESISSSSYLNSREALSRAVESQANYEAVATGSELGSSFNRLWAFLSERNNISPLRIIAPAHHIALTGRDIANALNRNHDAALMALEGFGVGHIITT
jgi:hypothetical protein